MLMHRNNMYIVFMHNFYIVTILLITNLSVHITYLNHTVLITLSEKRERERETRELLK